jgi:hypothetical protein
VWWLWPWLACLGGERLGGLEVEVVVQVQVVEVLAVDQQVEHVVALPTHLQPPHHHHLIASTQIFG